MTRQQFNVRLPAITTEQIEWIIAMTGLTRTQVVIMAIDRLQRDLERHGVSDADFERVRTSPTDDQAS